jgi:uncharacterized protein YegP (UPF0339 family)
MNVLSLSVGRDQARDKGRDQGRDLGRVRGGAVVHSRWHATPSTHGVDPAPPPPNAAFVTRPHRPGGWRWWLTRSDGDVLAMAPAPVHTPALARMETFRVRVAAANALAETYTDAGGSHRWRLLTRTGALLAVSAVGYASVRAAEAAVAHFRYAASHAELDD